MRHRVAHRKLGRVTEHRISLLRNQAQALLRHERIQTTVPKARELRPFVERLITIAKRGLAVVQPPEPEKVRKVRALNARRLVGRDIADDTVVTKLFESIAPRFEKRPGGYTRLLKVGPRRGDSADVAQIELVGSEYNPALESEGGEAAPEKATGMGGRLRAAARRLRGEKSEASEPKGDAEATKKARAPRKKKDE
jgi:large subunit ribosomal protein L17